MAERLDREKLIALIGRGRQTAWYNDVVDRVNTVADRIANAKTVEEMGRLIAQVRLMMAFERGRDSTLGYRIYLSGLIADAMKRKDELKQLQASSAEDLITQPREGFVYFIEMGGFIKIGFSVDPETRLRSLQTGAPHKAEILGVIKGGPETERALHMKFDDLRAHGEWFKKRARLTRYIEKVAGGASA